MQGLGPFVMVFFGYTAEFLWPMAVCELTLA